MQFSSQTEGASTASGSSGCTEFGLTKLSEADVADYDVIGVDDGQSFEDLASFCDSMVRAQIIMSDWLSSVCL